MTNESALFEMKRPVHMAISGKEMIENDDIICLLSGKKPRCKKAMFSQ